MHHPHLTRQPRAVVFVQGHQCFEGLLLYAVLLAVQQWLNAWYTTLALQIGDEGNQQLNQRLHFSVVCRVCALRSSGQELGHY